MNAACSRPPAGNNTRLSETPPPTLLFSIDLEEFYPAKPGTMFRSTPLPDLVDRYLAMLRGRIPGTFFTVGDVARRYPKVLQRIVAEGHELACHGDRHITLDQLSPAEFGRDLRANREAIQNAAGVTAIGFRAPLFSVTSATPHVHSILREEGFVYSSSVLPAPNPLYGWPEFGATERVVNGVLEIPVSTAPLFPKGPNLPVFGGTYFRVLPFPLVNRCRRRFPRSLPVQCFFHPYDIDGAQEWVMHAGVSGRRWMNALLFARRRSLPTRLRRFLDIFVRALNYSTYSATRLAT